VSKSPCATLRMGEEMRLPRKVAATGKQTRERTVKKDCVTKDPRLAQQCRAPTDRISLEH
jgi:hypothetical protein